MRVLAGSLTRLSLSPYPNSFGKNRPTLALFVEEVRRTHQPDAFQPQIDAILRRWHESGEIDILLDLIGLGAGATPSGDDVLVGILAGLSILEKVSRKEIQQLVRLRSGIQGRVKSRTPLPSVQMLLATCKQSFVEPVLEFSEEITLPTTSETVLLKHAKNISQLGDHSGLAMLLGLRSALTESLRDSSSTQAHRRLVE